jgi:hypothetical protein
MKITVFILAFLLFSGSLTAQENEVKGNQYDLKGKIISSIQLPPHCGFLATAVVIEFKVIQSSDISYIHDSITVIIMCPESYGVNFFEAEKIYTLKVSDQNPAKFDWIIWNDGLTTTRESGKTFWVIEMNKETGQFK